MIRCGHYLPCWHRSLVPIVIAGRLKAKDLKRLELACSHALRHEFVPLKLNIEMVTLSDESARTYLDR